jgi:hypothetical protein
MALLNTKILIHQARQVRSIILFNAGCGILSSNSAEISHKKLRADALKRAGIEHSMSWLRSINNLHIPVTELNTTARWFNKFWSDLSYSNGHGLQKATVMLIEHVCTWVKIDAVGGNRGTAVIMSRLGVLFMYISNARVTPCAEAKRVHWIIQLTGTVPLHIRVNCHTHTLLVREL